MAGYYVTMKVHNTYNVFVEARDEEEAKDKVMDLYYKGHVEDSCPGEGNIALTEVEKLPKPSEVVHKRCHGNNLQWSPVLGYVYYCPDCDEDLYTVEVERK